MSWTHHVPWLFYSTKSHFWTQPCLFLLVCLFICFLLLWPSPMDTFSDTSGQIVEKIFHRWVLEKTHYFFLLASDPSNFEEWSDSLRQLDCTQNVKLIYKFQFVWGKNSVSSEIQWIKQNPISFLLAHKCSMWSKWNTCRLLDTNRPICTSTSLGFFNMIICCTPLDIKPHPFSWRWQLALTANWCYLCGIVVIYSHLKGNDWMALWFLPRNCGAI